MSKRKVVFLVLIGIFLVGWFGLEKVVAASRPHFSHADLLITRADGTSFSFDAELALSDQDQAYGLMYIHSLDEKAGMIFPYNPPREVAFWMKNTLIPLDMLFIGKDGKIARIVAEARPQDITPIPSQDPVSAVIEINGGLSKKDGFAVGDKVISSAIKITP